MKEPLPSQVMTGYMISRAVVKGTKYLNRALTCLDTAIEETKELGVEVEETELGEIRKLLHESIAGLYGAKQAHNLLSEGLQAKGFRKVTKEDFEKYGVTGR